MKTNVIKEQIGDVALINKALKIGTLPLGFKRTRHGWAAFLPAKINQDGSIAELSKVSVCDWDNSLRQLRFLVASRYMAHVYHNSMECYINLRWAMKLPNWTGPYGAMAELSNAMQRAGLI